MTKILKCTKPDCGFQSIPFDDIETESMLKYMDLFISSNREHLDCVHECILVDEFNDLVYSECKQPDWSSIVSECKKKIMKKYPSYKNSWVGFNDKNFWNKRMDGELDEIKTSVGGARVEELIDLINICAMQVTNLLNTKVELKN